MSRLRNRSNNSNVPLPNRLQIEEKLVQAIYQNSTAAVFFHGAMADKLGLGATEEKTLFLLSGRGSLTAGEIATATGLSTASVTGLIDRLERKGFVRRVRDTEDRRRVIVELDQERFAELVRLFDSLGNTFSSLLDGFSDEQLVTIIDFVTRSTTYSQKAIALLGQGTE